MRCGLTLAVALLGASESGATADLATQLPSLPSSCNTCHTAGPGTPRNVFGQQVEAHANGGTLDWPSLCSLDADQDGATNGAELGDPCCTFTVGALITLPTSHPADASDTQANMCGGVEVPASWTCSPRWFGAGDGCDCGCGALDADCADARYQSCESNGCPDASGGAVVDVTAPTSCLPNAAASPWTCSNLAYGDGQTCDCGCGVADPDCASEALEGCQSSGCGPGLAPDPADTTACIEATGATPPVGEGNALPRPGWTCPAAWYGGGDGCDCGCGLVDTDCPRAAQLGDCDTSGCGLTLEGSTPKPSNIAQCIVLSEPAPEWTCDALRWGSGDGCDCGCGARDPDCGDEGLQACEYSGCASDEIVSAADISQCEASERGCAQTSAAGGGALWFALAVLSLRVCLRRRAKAKEDR